jgi:hypothetical protein
MARDPGLEALIADDLGPLPGLTGKAMFGGWAWLLHGKLLCGVRQRGILVRLGKGNDTWALEIPGITSMVMHNRAMQGWVNVAPEACADDALRRLLLDAALTFVRSLPPDHAQKAQ